ncbi:MAG: folylpolyglutamate synthase/dihydrofolate synthase family protein [Bacillota bacterium]|nr:folylpolyglutamate synthase/dihydrofolate synthase family protein [Bacillota bacterium]
MNYQQAIDKMHQLTKFGFNLGLQRIERLLELLGNPEKDLKVIHVGGTNGKGSTSAILASVLKATGLQVGVFTSPHLHEYTERIKINGIDIPQEEFAELLSKIMPLFTQMVNEGYEHPTEFEVNTAMALLYFHRRRVDIVVLEVGLGGAIDSTNVVDPLISVLTNVSLEHMDYLGDTIGEIATVKAGIIKKKRPVVTAIDHPEALPVVKAKCVQEDAPLYIVQEETAISVKSKSLMGQTFDIKLPGRAIADLQLPLLGEHQLLNSATALLVLHTLEEYYGYKIGEDQIRVGFKGVKWPARMELFSSNPTIMIDGAHNTAGVEVLVEALKESFSDKEIVLVMGMLADKEREKVVAMLAPLAKKIIVTKPNSPRAGQWQELASFASQYCSQVEVIEEIHQAVEQGIAAANRDDLVCITGSLYMVAEARQFLLDNKLGAE